MMIVPPQLGLYMALAPEQKLTFPLGGPAAQAAFEAGLAGFEAKSFRGLGIMTSTPVRSPHRTRDRFIFFFFSTSLFSRLLAPRGAQYEVSDDQDSVQMLQRSSQMGEFYRMSPPMAWDENRGLPASYMGASLAHARRGINSTAPHSTTTPSLFSLLRVHWQTS